MNKLFPILILSCVLFLCCKTNKKITSKTEENISNQIKDAQSPKSGYFEMGIIDYKIIDTIEMDDATAQMMLEMMKSSIEGVYVYNEFSGAQVKFQSADSTVVSSEYFNNESREIIQFLYSNVGQFMFKSDLDALMSKMPEPTEEELLEFQNLFKRENGVDDKKFGFMCDRVKMYDPEDLTTPRMTMLMTREIPFMSNSFGIIGELMGGFPIRMSTIMGGLEVDSGALSHHSDEKYAKYLFSDQSNFTELDEAAYSMKLAEVLAN